MIVYLYPEKQEQVLLRIEETALSSGNGSRTAG